MVVKGFELVLVVYREELSLELLNLIRLRFLLDLLLNLLVVGEVNVGRQALLKPFEALGELFDPFACLCIHELQLGFPVFVEIGIFAHFFVESKYFFACNVSVHDGHIQIHQNDVEGVALVPLLHGLLHKLKCVLPIGCLVDLAHVWTRAEDA